MTTAADVIGRSDGKIVTVEFIKRTDGKRRVMNCRLGVKSKLRGGKSKYDPLKKGLVVVFDMQAGEYRSIPLDSVVCIKAEGETHVLQAA